MDFKVVDLGLVDFKKAWQFQKDLFDEIRDNGSSGALILCRHNPVITLGRQGNADNIKLPLAELEKKGIDLYKVERAGDVTYHGPGQLVVYPVFNLRYLKKDIHFFIRQLESLAIDLLSWFGVSASIKKGLTGVWVGKNKIASIGIAIRHWITFHGMSINIKAEDLRNFSLIRPCGLDVEMVSLETLCGESIGWGRVKDIFLREFKDNFGRRLL